MMRVKVLRRGSWQVVAGAGGWRGQRRVRIVTRETWVVCVGRKMFVFEISF